MKIILKRSQPPTPAAIPEGIPILPATPGVAIPPTPSSASALPPSVTMTQKGRVSRPTAKKRARDFDESEDDSGRPAARAANGGGPPKRPKLILKKSSLKVSRTASIVLKQVQKEAPPHSRGEGYDSEEEDRETDPLIEEEFVLRMLPGEHCDYLRRMVDERKIGVPAKDGGAEFQMRWLPGMERRALVTVRGTHFVGVLVDLPTITEGMKTWDKRNFMKSADVCQMLLVFATVADETEAKSIALPAMVAKDFRWPHGLTPPMHDCIHRRFRKRLSKKEIKDKEAELQRLLNEDRIALESKWELFDDGRTENGADEEEEDIEMADEDADEDAYGEVDEDYFGQQHGQQFADGDAEGEIDEAELMAEFMEEEDDTDAKKDYGAGEKLREVAAESGASGAAAAATVGSAVPSSLPSTSTPRPAASDAEEDEEEEDEEDDDDDDDLDEDEQARAEQAKGVREDINELKKTLQTLDSQLATTNNALLRKRVEGTRKRVLSELRLKQASIGEIDEEE